MAHQLDDHKRRVMRTVSIVDVVSPHVELRQKGGRWWGLCPFHSEKTGSFSVNPDGGMYYCFGCKESGDHITFLREVEGLSFIEALKKLSQMSGIPMPEMERDTPKRRAERQARQSVEERLIALHEEARGYYRRQFEKGGEALDYAKGRGLTAETLEAWGIGYVPPGWNNLLDHAKKRGFEAGLLVQAGLAIRKDRDGGGGGGADKVWDRFRRRLIFPIHDHRGRCVGFGGRSIDPEDEPKYLNSPESPIYHKSEVLFGLNRARTPIRKTGFAMVLEGYMDVISLAQAGFDNGVATCGTALTPQQASLLRRSCERVVFVYDGDDAGQAAMRKGAVPLLEAGLHVRVVALPPEHDPDSFVQQLGAEAFRERLDNAQEVFDYFLGVERAKFGTNTAEGRVRLVESMLDLLAVIKHPVARQHCLDRLAYAAQTEARLIRGMAATRVDKMRQREAIAAERERNRMRRDPDEPAWPEVDEDNEPAHRREGGDADHVEREREQSPALAEATALERGLLRVMIDKPEFRDRLGDTIHIDWIDAPFVRHCLERLAASDEVGGEAIEMLRNHVARSEPEQEMLTAIFMWGDREEANDFANVSEKTLANMANRLRLQHLRTLSRHHARATEDLGRYGALAANGPGGADEPETETDSAQAAYLSASRESRRHNQTMGEVYPWLPRSERRDTGPDGEAEEDHLWEDGDEASESEQRAAAPPFAAPLADPGYSDDPDAEDEADPFLAPGE